MWLVEDLRATDLGALDLLTFLAQPLRRHLAARGRLAADPHGQPGGGRSERAVGSLITQAYGGPVMQAPDAIRLLDEVGFSRALALPGQS